MSVEREKVVRQDVEVAEEGSPLRFAEMSMFPFKSFKWCFLLRLTSKSLRCRCLNTLGVFTRWCTSALTGRPSVCLNSNRKTGRQHVCTQSHHRWQGHRGPQRELTREMSTCALTQLCRPSSCSDGRKLLSPLLRQAAGMIILLKSGYKN